VKSEVSVAAVAESNFPHITHIGAVSAASLTVGKEPVVPEVALKHATSARPAPRVNPFAIKPVPAVLEPAPAQPPRAGEAPSAETAPAVAGGKRTQPREPAEKRAAGAKSILPLQGSAAALPAAGTGNQRGSTGTIQAARGAKPARATEPVAPAKTAHQQAEDVDLFELFGIDL